MDRIRSISFYLGVALLFTHELDSMSNHEWRVLPILSALPDSAGQRVFLLAHVPIFAVVIALVASLKHDVRTIARNTVCAFLVFHGLLHYLFSGHPAYEFSSLDSSLLIYAAAVCGLTYVLLYKGEHP